MTIQEAINSLKPFSRPNWEGNRIQYFLPKTGPHQELVDCNYFVITEDGQSYFSTSIDLYPEDLLASDYFLI